MSIVNVKDYGALGDGLTDDTLAFQDALDALLNTFEKGVLYCPSGTYILSSQLDISLPFVGIKGDSVEGTRLRFDGCSGIKLTEWIPGPPANFYGFSQAAIEDLTIEGVDTLSSGHTYKAVEMEGSNYYYFNRFWIRGFDFGVFANRSILNKFENFSIAGCKTGMQFQGASYANTILNGNINGCTEAGIVEIASEIYVSMTDIEAIGTPVILLGPGNVPYTDHYEDGTAIKTGYSTTVRDCHFELCGEAIGLDSSFGEVLIENSIMVTCVTGVKQLAGGSPVGRYHFKNLRFADCDTEFDMMTMTDYQIENCTARYDGGSEKAPVINADPLRGIVSGSRFSAIGYWKSYTNTPGILVNGKEVWAGKRFNASVTIGTVAANSSVQIPLTVDAAYPDVSMNVYTDTLLFSLSYPDCVLPAGLWIDACIATTGIGAGARTRDFVLNVSNITGSAINMGTPTFLFRTLQGA